MDTCEMYGCPDNLAWGPLVNLPDQKYSVTSKYTYSTQGLAKLIVHAHLESFCICSQHSHVSLTPTYSGGLKAWRQTAFRSRMNRW